MNLLFHRKSHKSSLRSVTFKTKNAAVNLRPIFWSLRDLPCLQAIHLSFPFGHSAPCPFPAYDMLYSCQHHLKFLSLEFAKAYNPNRDYSRSISLFSEDWCFVNLPRLRELRVVPPTSQTLDQGFVNYIHRFAPSLISLWINPHHDLVLCLSKVNQLSSIFSDFLSLRNLTICIRLFCPDILVLLAKTLPQLRTLTLKYFEIGSTTIGYVWTESGVNNIFSEVIAFSSCFPCNVEWFCGVERSTYISQAKEFTLST